MALTARYRAVELALMAYAAVVTAVALDRAPAAPGNWGIALAHALVVVLVLLLARAGASATGRALRDVAPLLLLLGLYAALDVLHTGPYHRSYDALVLGWEERLFGMQPARDWWQRHPSRFWSTVLHGVYFGYYLILAVPALFFLARGDRPALRGFTRAVMTTFCVCFLVFIFLPVAGPYYTFARPTGPFVETVTAKLVYASLTSGSSYGAAFPSSHVAATTAAGIAAWRGSRRLGLALLAPVVLMPIATVYCQMHYAVDALAGIGIGLSVPALAARLEGADLSA